MNLHEYQAKRLFVEYGIPVPQGDVVRTAEEARRTIQRGTAGEWVVKAQVHAGARGKGGGVRKFDDAGAASAFAESLLGQRLVTPQTSAEGLPVHAVLVEEPMAIDRELYLGMLIDREREQITLIASSAGGMDIEAVAAETPEALLKIQIDPCVGLQPYQCRQVCFGLDLGAAQLRPLTQILDGVYRLFNDFDLSLIEINPLVLTKDGRLLALDAKINIDDNALYRQPRLNEMRDLTQENPIEIKAAEYGLNYIALDGNIACMVNGAGLAMATMDVVHLYGGEPANFLDVGGSTTADRVAQAVKLILSIPGVEALLVNIFGGIVRCDLIAEGIIQADREVGITIPVVVRVEGTHVDRCRVLLENSGLKLVMADDLTDAARKVVAMVNKASVEVRS